MPSDIPLTPGATATIAATTSSSRVAFGLGGRNVMITSAGTGIAFIKFGDATVTAAVTDTPILANAIYTMNRGDALDVAAITATGTATLYFTSCEGV